MSTDPTSATSTADQAASQQGLTPAEAQQRAAYSHRLAAAFGEIVTVLMRSPAYRNATLAQIERLVVPAVLTGQFSLAEAQSKESGFMSPVGVAIWATVNAETEAVLALSPDAYQRLTPAEWRNGETVWLIDAVGDQRVIGPMLKRLHETSWKGRLVKAHIKGPDGASSIQTLAPSI